MTGWGRLLCSTVLGGVLLCRALLAAAADPLVASCGDTIGPGGSFVLTADVGPCDTTTDPALTVIGPVTLDMGRHSLTCATEDGLPLGIAVLGSNAVLRRGKVRGCAAAIEVAGDGGHRVKRMTVDDYAGDGFAVAVRSTGNRIIRNRARTCDLAEVQLASGFLVEADGNVLRQNRVNGRGCGSGFTVVGDENTLVLNLAKRIGRDAFFVSGDGNTLDRNTIASSDSFGFYVDGDGDVLTGNVALHVEGPGFSVDGLNHQLGGNVASATGANGFQLNGVEMTVTGNFATGGLNGFLFFAGPFEISGNVAIENREAGFALRGSENVLTGNVAIANHGEEGSAGFDVDGVSHVLIGNRAFDNVAGGIRVDASAADILLEDNVAYSNDRSQGTPAFDLSDEGDGCGSNVWQGNRFGSRNQTCIE